MTAPDWLPDWLPDWTDATRYPADLPLHEWRWQFIRRSREYQDDWAAWVSSGDVVTGDAMNGAFWAGPADLAEAYGMARLIAPEMPRADDAIGVAAPFFFRRIETDFQEDLSRIGYQGVYFDLTEAPEPQIDALRRVLRELQQRARDKKRQHLRLWPLYLRTLDARAAGVSFAKIAELLDPDNPADEPKARDQRARDWFRAATDIQRGFIQK